MNSYYAKRKAVKHIIDRTFPGNKKQKVRVETFHGPINVNSYWDGGSKDEYRILNLATGVVSYPAAGHPYFDRCGNKELTALQENEVLVQAGTFCGKPATPTVYFLEKDYNEFMEVEHCGIDLS